MAPRLVDLSAKCTSNNGSATVLHKFHHSCCLSFRLLHAKNQLMNYSWTRLANNGSTLLSSQRRLLAPSLPPSLREKVQWTAWKISNDARRFAKHTGEASAASLICHHWRRVNNDDVNIHDTSNYMRSFVRQSLKTSVWTWTALPNSNGHILDMDCCI